MKSLFRTFLLWLGVAALAAGISFLLIVAGSYVEKKWQIGAYAAVMFIILPVVTYVLISLYMWVLERWLSD